MYGAGRRTLSSDHKPKVEQRLPSRVHDRTDWRPDELIFVGHALLQMARRRISRHEATEALNTCHTCLPVRLNRGQAHIGTTAAGRRIKVVVDADSFPPRVVTVAEPEGIV